MFVNLQFYLHIELYSQFYMHTKAYTTNRTFLLFQIYYQYILEIDPSPNYHNIIILWYIKNNFSSAFFHFLSCFPWIKQATCFHFISCFPWIKQAAKLQSYINTCKEIMYLHLFPQACCHWVTINSIIQFSIYIFFM